MNLSAISLYEPSPLAYASTTRRRNSTGYAFGTPPPGSPWITHHKRSRNKGRAGPRNRAACPINMGWPECTMKAVFQAFFKRSHFHSSLQCESFDFDPARDVFNDPLSTDGAVCKRCDELLRGFLRTHHRALVVIDRHFGGERPADEVRTEMEVRLRRSGWGDRVQVVVIDPELEVWLWQDNPNVQRALNYQGSLRQDLIRSGEWPTGAAKPLQPKETMLKLIHANRAGAPMAVYARIAETVSVNGCVDGTFAGLRSTLRSWFPVVGA